MGMDLYGSSSPGVWQIRNRKGMIVPLHYKYCQAAGPRSWCVLLLYVFFFTFQFYIPYQGSMIYISVLQCAFIIKDKKLEMNKSIST